LLASSALPLCARWPRSWTNKIMLATAARLIVARRLADRQEQSTITPEATLREAGISTKRQARYQRRMSSLLAGRE